MGIIWWRGTSGYALITDLKNEFEEEENAPKDSPITPTDSLPAIVPMETETDASPAEQEAQTKQEQLST